jgi:hypothetical protein
MPPRSLQDHVQSLIGRTVAEQKIVGTNASDVEARAVLESIALNLLLQPRAVLYLAHLARNGLLSIVNQELAAIDTLSKTVSDTANSTFLPSSTLHLDRARTALLQMETLEKIDSKGKDFQRFDVSINDFLEKNLSKSVRRKGSPDLVRPDTEAAVDLTTDFSTLVALHEELNQRLYALSVGIENFSSSPLGTILGLSTAYRARLDIEDIISIIDSGESGNQARDIAIRLIGDRSAVKALGNLPTLSGSLVNTATGLPAGYSLKAQSDFATAVATSVAGPWVFAPSATAAVTVNGVTLTKTHFPQTAIHLDNRAFIVTSPAVFFPFFPITMPAGKWLFLHLRRATPAAGFVLQPEGDYLRQVRVAFSAGPITLTTFLNDLNTALGADGTAAEYLQVNTGRIIIIGEANITSIRVAAMVQEPSTTTLGDPHIFDSSLHDVMGLEVGQVGVSGSTPVEIVLDALNLYFSSLIEATATENQEVRFETIDDVQGTQMTLALPAAMSVNGTFSAVSNSIKLYGTINGKEPVAVPGDLPTPVDPGPLMDVQDLFTGPTGQAIIQGLTTTRIILDTALPTFDGDVSVSSALVEQIFALDKSVQAYLADWLKTKFAQDLSSIDRAIAALSGKITPATRQEVQTLLTDLKNNVTGLATALSVGPVSSSMGTDERRLVSGIINTLTERKYDRALSQLLRLQVQEFFEMTGETASFGGNLLKTMTDFATTDIQFPNTQLDEDSGFKGEIKEPQA